MNYKSLICGMAILSSVINGCSQETKTNNWNPGVSLLDKNARIDQMGSSLAHDVKAFYQFLRNKDWHETYEGRARAFRHDVLESDYTSTAKKYENSWGLADYEVLSVDFQDSDVAILICKFIELPDYTISYSTVFWHREGGVWKCLSAGPKKLGIFEKTRPIMIDWN
jgi:hypothetical protein